MSRRRGRYKKFGPDFEPEPWHTNGSDNDGNDTNPFDLGGQDPELVGGGPDPELVGGGPDPELVGSGPDHGGHDPGGQDPEHVIGIQDPGERDPEHEGGGPDPEDDFRDEAPDDAAQSEGRNPGNHDLENDIDFMSQGIYFDNK